MKSRLTLACVLSLMAAMFAACGGAGSTTSSVPTSAPASNVPNEPIPQDEPQSAAQVEPVPRAAEPQPAAPESKPVEQPPAIRQIGDTVSVGYTSYRVHKVWWSNKLSNNEFLNHAPDAMYLFVQLTIRNDDTKPRSVPPFSLLDESSRQYQTSDHGWAVEGSIGVLDSLNPNVAKSGFIVFDVPPEHAYSLKISGGYWSGESAMIELADSEAIARKQGSDKMAAEKAAREARQAVQAEQHEREDKAKWHTWTSANGAHQVNGKFVSKIGDAVTIQREDGKQIKLKVSQLSDADQEFINKRGWTAAN